MLEESHRGSERRTSSTQEIMGSLFKGDLLLPATQTHGIRSQQQGYENLFPLSAKTPVVVKDAESRQVF